MEAQNPFNQCPSCHAQVLPTAYFCPNCGKKLKEPPASTTLSKQLVVYAIAFLAPPFGLIPAIKYLRSPEPKAKMMGLVAVILTFVSLAIAVIAIQQFISAYTQALQMTTGGNLGI